MESTTGRLTPHYRVAMVGSGNVATHLVRSLANDPAIDICAISSRHAENAFSLADEISKPDCATDFESIAQSRPDIIIVSVADGALKSVVDKIGPINSNPLVLLTSGTMEKEILEYISPRTGVLYPLQTFSKNTPVDLSKVPFFTEAATPDDLFIADWLASRMSSHVYHADSAKRGILHIAGVFSSNFVDILLESVEKILQEGGYDLSTVKPLVEATVAKAFDVGPHQALTGPAKRGDMEVVALQHSRCPEELKDSYRVLTQLITKFHNPHINCNL